MGILSLIGSIIALSHSPEAAFTPITVKRPTNSAYVVTIPKAKDVYIKPYVSKELKTTQEIYDNTTNKIVINAGYFDPMNGLSTSYVTIGSNKVLDPTLNDRLMLNPELKAHLSEILNRSEFRILDCNGVTKFDIAYHNEIEPNKCEITDSIQAGPMLLPTPSLEKEYFVVEKDGKVQRDSISALKKVSRTAIGIKGDDVYLIIATDESPMTIAELSDFAKTLKLDKAMAFDGGSSTSMNYPGLTITSNGDGKGRKVKSFLVINY